MRLTQMCLANHIFYLHQMCLTCIHVCMMFDHHIFMNIMMFILLRSRRLSPPICGGVMDSDESARLDVLGSSS